MDTAKATREGIASEIRAAMGRKRMTQSTLARLIGRSRPWLSERLVGKRAFTTDQLVVICEALDLDLLGLFPDQMEPIEQLNKAAS